MLKKTILSLIITCTTLAAFPAMALGYELAPGLESRVNAMNSAAADSTVSIVVFMNNDQTVPLGVAAERADLTRAARIKNTLTELKGNLTSAEGDRVAAFLAETSTTEVVRHWIVPAFAASIPLSQIERLGALPGVSLIVEDAALIYDEPVSVSSTVELATGISSELIALDVPEVWKRGVTGKGTLVCNFDTGVEGDHPALASKWRGNDRPLSECWFSSVAPNAFPDDIKGHGTHTMGVMVGSHEADSFGVAPGAEWISAGVIDQGRSLSTTLNDIILAFQWALNPDGDAATTDDVPDVILNSWGVPQGLFAPCDDTFAQVIAAAEAAGIVTIFSAGNEGPKPASLRHPADFASSPTNTFAVGAIDRDLVVAGFSARGPSTCDADQLKPEVMAPGVGIRSSYKDGGYMVMGGTSMAAPYVAGIVALLRQYNPDATVEQIKNALMMSATDLGVPGEDNAYGHGLVNAARALDYLPGPAEQLFVLSKVEVSDGLAVPGTSVSLEIALSRLAGNSDRVIAVLESVDSEVIILQPSMAYDFALDATATGDGVYRMFLPNDLQHGADLTFRLLLTEESGVTIDTLSFLLPVGHAPDGAISDVSSARIDFSISDFGQFGFGPGSIYNVGGQGFRVDGGPNLLFEAGLILGRSPVQLASAVRDSLGQFAASEFEATRQLTGGIIAADGSVHQTASCADSRSEVPIPIAVDLDAMIHPLEDGFLIMRFDLRNSSLERATELHLGLLFDFDLSDGMDFIGFDQASSLIYQSTSSGPLVGLVGLRNVASFKTYENAAGKRGFTQSELYDMISSTGNAVDGSALSDWMFELNTAAVTLEPYQTREIAVAVVVGDDLADLRENAERALQAYDIATDAPEDNGQTLPSGCELSQNYPNPFNPVTTIQFSLATATDVSLGIYNALGQKVRTLVSGRATAGSHTVEWDSRGDRGQAVASGVYFYRLETDDETLTRKMLLLK